jgi:S-methylmethionine-dependent homocysteine/selenocysteine methylase
LIGWLVEAGVDLILIETMNTIQEAVAAAHAAKTTGLPISISWTCASDGNILSGESLSNAILSVEQYKPSAFLVNCTPAKDIGPALRKMRETAKVPIGAYANIGKPEPIYGWEFTHELDPSAYAFEAEDWVREGAKIIGGCCGTTPEHISALKNLFQK